MRRWRFYEHVLAVLVFASSRLILGLVTTRMLSMPEDLLRDRLIHRVHLLVFLDVLIVHLRCRFGHLLALSVLVQVGAASTSEHTGRRRFLFSLLLFNLHLHLPPALTNLALHEIHRLLTSDDVRVLALQVDG